MFRIRVSIFVLCVVCLTAPAVARAADGSVAVYLQPLPAEAARLTFALASVSAVTTTGSEYALTLKLKAIGPADASRQRLLASGRVPAGGYAGFTIRVKRAALKTAQGEAALSTTDAPVRLDVPFTVSGQQSPVFWFALRYDVSITGGFAFAPLFSVAAPPRPIADHAGFVANAGANTITVFDKRLGQAVGLIDTCAGPTGMALDQARRRAYVACAKDDEIESIDVATSRIIDRSRTSPGDHPRELALTPDGTTLLSVNGGSNTVTFFDAASLTRQERLTVGSGPASILVEPAGRRAFVFNTLSSSLSVIDVASRTVVATLSTDSGPLRGRFNARGDKLYVVHERSPYMTVLDPRQLAVVARARLRIGVSAIEVDTVRDLVCLGGLDDSAVEFYDPNALMPLFSLRSTGGVGYLKIDAQQNTLYMVSREKASVAVGRLADRKIMAEIDVGDDPCWVAVAGEK